MSTEVLGARGMLRGDVAFPEDVEKGVTVLHAEVGHPLTIALSSPQPVV